MESLPASDLPLIKEVWIRMWEWYNDSIEHHSPPARVSIDHMTAERMDLYWDVPFPGHPVPVGLHPLPVKDSVL